MNLTATADRILFCIWNIRMADELIDIFDDNLNFISQAMKSEAHNNGWWHKVFFCWLIRRTKDGRRKIWLQLRNKRKLIGGGLLDASSAGHFASGENLQQALCREVKEELGLDLPFDNIIQFGITKRLSGNKAIKNAEIVHRCYAQTSATLSELCLQKNELDGIFEMDLEDAIALFNDDVPKITVTGLAIGENNAYIPTIRQVSIADFMDYGKNTYRDFFINLQNMLKENDNGGRNN